jgi:hypothetical protein
MNINLYINNDSFINNGENLDHIYTRIEELDQLSESVDKINEQKIKLNRPKDLIYKDIAIYDQLFFDNKTVSDFIYSPLKINNDYKVLLRALIDKSAIFHTDEEIHNHISFYESNPNYIYNKDNLTSFYYNFFNTLDNGEEFYYGIKIHFPKLTLSVNVQNTLTEIEGDLPNFSIKIIKTLIYLNDTIKEKFKETHNLKRTLELLTEEISFYASEQGKSKTKLDFEFQYEYKDGKPTKRKTVCCDPHVKYNRGEEAKVEKEYYRLYFHMGDKDIDNGNILIGHIGKHIE